ncbi:hypothetical protein QTG54_010469 [Skeletonema marinoi]|uniref:Uncharacterized protein n=1 Tax=Skeletonema marinoi TaxID=267567 RepID=A0A7S2LYY1_9STRA|nr:hypothetical protein QTG54_010469 [Skeletonema marinoi]|mmetsp:Transcript_32351/g.54632  ORF Transcript_32351/g.54632 Transcript_32351/m.54632 type:complete len:392 (+) Transcript_32351:60-1235(+)
MRLLRERTKYSHAIWLCLSLSMVSFFFLQQNSACNTFITNSESTNKKNDAMDDEPEATAGVEDYQPGSAEQYIMNNLDQLGFNKANNPATCHIWNDNETTTPEVYDSLVTYKKDIDRYNEIIEKFNPVPSTMDMIRQDQGGGGALQSIICDSLRLHPDGMQGIFPSKQLSFTSSGYVEPLLPPMRSHKICDNHSRNLMSLDYLVHDFEFMCKKLKPTSRLVLLDMGASLDFHGTAVTPIVTLLKQYEKFGFVFDHIYGFEITKKDPNVIYNTSLPEEYIPSYHWINVGVSSKEGDKLNPLHSIIKKLNEDDFVVVKLDIDTSSIEVPLARELLEDKDGVYSKIIDQFYFEHHVHLGELAGSWRSSMNGTVGESLELFSNLRKKGIPAHFWP